jgi:hypothetical protein
MEPRLTPIQTASGPSEEVPRGPSISRRNFIAGLGVASGAVVVGVAISGAGSGGAALGAVSPPEAEPDFTSTRSPCPRS